MFFILSKLFWLVAAPSSLLTIALVVGALLLFTRFAPAGRALVALAALGALIAATGLPGVWLLRPLEGRFARPPPDASAPYGIIVLGGGMDEVMLATRGALELNDYGSRMTDAVALALRYPQARLAFTGGAAVLSPERALITEAAAARAFFVAEGVAPERLILEDRSRNTAENANFLAAVAHPQAGQHWLLVTSAFHMPRAMGLFRRARFEVAAYPSDYKTVGTARELWRPRFDLPDGLRDLDLGSREWIGLLAYRLTGRTDALLPGP